MLILMVIYFLYQYIKICIFSQTQYNYLYIISYIVNDGYFVSFVLYTFIIFVSVYKNRHILTNTI